MHSDVPQEYFNLEVASPNFCTFSPSIVARLSYSQIESFPCRNFPFLLCSIPLVIVDGLGGLSTFPFLSLLIASPFFWGMRG